MTVDSGNTTAATPRISTMKPPVVTDKEEAGPTLRGGHQVRRSRVQTVEGLKPMYV
jgi:hypothetical protein